VSRTWLAAMLVFSAVLVTVFLFTDKPISAAVQACFGTYWFLRVAGHLEEPKS
jgi:hypothetical protein